MPGLLATQAVGRTDRDPDPRQRQASHLPVARDLLAVEHIAGLRQRLACQRHTPLARAACPTKMVDDTPALAGRLSNEEETTGEVDVSTQRQASRARVKRG